MLEIAMTFRFSLQVQRISRFWHHFSSISYQNSLREYTVQFTKHITRGYTRFLNFLETGNFVLQLGKFLENIKFEES